MLHPKATLVIIIISSLLYFLLLLIWNTIAAQD